jgi:hypothetical protein
MTQRHFVDISFVFNTAHNLVLAQTETLNHANQKKKPKPNKKILIQRHLNFEVRFHLENKIVTHKSAYFNKDQIHPSINKCCTGRCMLSLCHIAEANGIVAEKIYDPSIEGINPLIGKLVKILSLGGISFHDPDSHEEDLDLNWKRLRNMAQSVVDEQEQRDAGGKRSGWREPHSPW